MKSAVVIVVLGFIIINLTILLVVAILENTFSYEIGVAYIMFLILIIIAATNVTNFRQEFTVTYDGIEFQVFIFWRILVPWVEIQKIKESYGPWAKYHIVIVDRLTPFHRIIGLLYGLTLSHGFVIDKQLIDYEDAIELIKGKLHYR
ncbi:MAG: hypothetical protein OEV06_00015 [Anaerolineae bacterium]|nr:hypothetical protein [Anaerolineae bacterium]